MGYGGRPVVTDVSLSVRGGEFAAVIGPNAGGKTTLLKTLASLLKPLSGVVYLDGVEMAKMSMGEVAKLVGVVLTEQPRHLQLTVYETVALGRYPHTGHLNRLSEKDRREIMRALREVGIGDLAERRLGELSDGQRQKVMLARALAQEPKILLLDEPVTFLDPKARVEILKTVKRICRERGIAAVASLHEVELALRMADRLIVVSHGRVEMFDSPEDFVARGGPLILYGLESDITFSSELMSLEFTAASNGGPRVFVVAGGGSGALVYRMLARLGYRFSTGVLHRGDIDFEVANLLGGQVIGEEAFHPIRPETVEQALEEAQSCSAAIYTSPPIGPLNSANLLLAEEIMFKGVPLVVLGGGEVRGAWSRVWSLNELSLVLRELFKNVEAAEHSTLSTGEPIKFIHLGKASRTKD